MSALGRKILLLITPLFLAMAWFGTAAAAGETYQWQDTSGSAIIGQGGVYQQSTTLPDLTTIADPALFNADISSSCHVTIMVHRADVGKAGASATVITNPTSCAAVDPSTTIGATTATATANTDNGNSCNAGSMSWIMCPIFEGGLGLVKWVETSVITPFLQVQPLSMDSNYTPHQIWDSFRNLADVAFVVIFLIMVFSQTSSLGLDTYSARRLLPRLAAAAVLIQFSYVLVALGIDIANVLGAGVEAIALKPISGHTTIAINGVTAGIGLGAGIVGAVAIAGGLVSGAIFLALFTALLGVLLVFLTLVFRQILIIFLLIISPIAFVLWILPNTEHFFKLWSRNLIRLLLMYPLIILLFASGQIFGAAVNAGNGTGFGNSSLRSIISVIANALPLFLLPATFGFAGELMVRAHQGFRLLHGATRGASEKSGAYQQYKTRTQQRKRDLAAGQGVNMTFGLGGRRFTGTFTSHVGAVLGRGAFESMASIPPGRKAADVRAQAAYTKVRSEWEKRLKDEGLTFEGYQVLSRGQDWADAQIGELRGKVRHASTTDEAKSLNATINRYQQAKDMAGRYRNVNAARDAAALWLGNIGQAEEIDRLEIVRRSKPTRTGKLIASQVWGDTRNAGRTSNVHLAFKDIEGNYDDVNLRKYVERKGQGDWAGFSADAFKELVRNGAIAKLTETGGGRSTLAGILGSGGPQAGPEMQKIVTDALKSILVDNRLIDVEKLKKTKGGDW